MKKIELKFAAQLLTKEQMKNIGGGDDDCDPSVGSECSSDSDCPKNGQPANWNKCHKMTCHGQDVNICAQVNEIAD